MTDEPMYLLERLSGMSLDESGYYAVFHFDGPSGPMTFAYPRELLNEIAEFVMATAASGADVGDGKRITDAFRARSMRLDPVTDSKDVALTVGFGKKAEIRLLFPRSVAEQLLTTLQEFLKP